jgi:hypothetical protein
VHGVKPAYDGEVTTQRWWLAGLAAALVGCGHADERPIDAAIDAPPRVVDLAPIAARMSAYTLSTETIESTDCQVVEGCVGGSGARTLLRFPTVTGNVGTTDLVMPPLPPVGQSDTVYEWSPCHGHHHVRDFASFELLGPTGVLAVARKQAFCLEDSASIANGGQGGKFTCTGQQGISVGWTDIYVESLACEYIDVTDQAPGDYTLRVTINPDGNLPDADPTNNVFTMPVTLPAPAP